MTATHAGIYRATVVDNNDPESRNRLKVRVPSLTGMAVVGWVWPCLPPGVAVLSPRPGEGVWVMFENGDPDYPVWTGVFEAGGASAGGGGGSSEVAGTFEWTQTTPSDTWVIPHNLGYKPGGIRVKDSADSEVEGDIQDLTANTVVISFSAPFAGVAYLS